MRQLDLVLGQPDHVTYQLTQWRHSIGFDIDIEEEEVTIVLGIASIWKNGIGPSLLISMLFPLAESWLVNSNFSRASRMQGSLEFLGASPVFITLWNLICMFFSFVRFGKTREYFWTILLRLYAQKSRKREGQTTFSPPLLSGSQSRKSQGRIYSILSGLSFCPSYEKNDKIGGKTRRLCIWSFVV